MGPVQLRSPVRLRGEHITLTNIQYELLHTSNVKLPFAFV
jgi:hypothetical protein